MGRIKTTLIKRTTLDLFNQYRDKITSDFKQQKKFVEQKVNVSSKKIRNIIAGYAVRLSKKKD